MPSDSVQLSCLYPCWTVAQATSILGSDVGSRSQRVSFCIPRLLLTGTSLVERGCCTRKPNEIKLKFKGVKIDGIMYVRCVPFMLCLNYMYIYGCLPCSDIDIDLWVPGVTSLILSFWISSSTFLPMSVSIFWGLLLKEIILLEVVDSSLLMSMLGELRWNLNWPRCGGNCQCWCSLRTSREQRTEDWPGFIQALRIHTSCHQS